MYCLIVNVLWLRCILYDGCVNVVSMEVILDRTIGSNRYLKGWAGGHGTWKGVSPVTRSKITPIATMIVLSTRCAVGATWFDRFRRRSQVLARFLAREIGIIFGIKSKRTPRVASWCTFIWVFWETRVIIPKTIGPRLGVAIIWHRAGVTCFEWIF